MNPVNPQAASDRLREAYWAIDRGELELAKRHIADVGIELAIDGALAQRDELLRECGPARIAL